MKRLNTLFLASVLTLTALTGCKAQATFDASKASFDINGLYGKNWVIGAPMVARLQFNNDGTALFTEADGDIDHLLYFVNGKQIKLYDIDDDSMRPDDLEATFDVVSLSADALRLKAVGGLRQFDLDDDVRRVLDKDNILNLTTEQAQTAAAPEGVSGATGKVRGVSGATTPKTVPAGQTALDPALSSLSNITDLFKSWTLVSVTFEGRDVTPRKAKVYTFDNQGNFTEYEPADNDTDRYRYSLRGTEIAVFEADDNELEDLYQITKLTADELQLQFLIKDALTADRDDQRKAGALLNFKKK